MSASELPQSRSSSASLSSPPRSPSPSAQLNDSTHSITVNPAAPLMGPNGAILKKDGTVRKKPGRKPAPVDPNAPPKRKRKPRDPNAPPTQRRKPRESLGSNAAAPTAAASSSSVAANVMAAAGPVPAAAGHAFTHDAQNPPPSSFFSAPPPPPPPPTQHQPPAPTPNPNPPPFRSASSGQNYDPIRSNYDPVRETVVTHNHYSTSQGSPSQPPPPSTNRASASPSISSLVDPPNHPSQSPSLAAQSFLAQQQLRRAQPENQNSAPPSPSSNRPAPSIPETTSFFTNQPPPNTARPGPLSEGLNNAPSPTPASSEPKKKDVERKNSGSGIISKKSVANGSTATSSAAPSPKPAKVKEPKEPKDAFPAPPPLPGQGLMGNGPNDGTEFRAPTVVLNIPMNGETNKYINFTRLAEAQYGWDALHPRLAAQRDRLARVAAAGAALERNGSGKESGDDMSLDSEGEGEGSNVEMGGMSDGRNGTGTDGGKKKPAKRKMKEDEYDKLDGFVDDTELLWDEQAAAATDGFFVYSGPLVPEGEKPVLESTRDGAPKRARGRGRGGTTRGGAAARSRGDATGTSPRTGLPLSGPGSRGGNTNRKPRITKADRAKMEAEKKERENMAMGTMPNMPTSYGPSMTLASAASMGNTPIVFNQ